MGICCLGEDFLETKHLTSFAVWLWYNVPFPACISEDSDGMSLSDPSLCSWRSAWSKQCIHCRPCPYLVS